MFRLMNKSRAGFSLIEIMVALTILGFIMAMVGTRFMRTLDEAKVRTTQNQMRILEAALSDFYRQNGFYPSTEQGLDALIHQPTAGRIPRNYPEGGYLERQRLPLDGWDNEFIYRCDDGFNFEIISLGADGREGGEGFAADISSKDL